MGMTVYIAKDDLADPRRQQRKPRPRKRQTRKEIRERNGATTEVDRLDDEEELFRFLAFTPARRNLPMMSRWDPTGRPWCHTPDEIEWIADEVKRALLDAEPGSDQEVMLEQLLGLARRAVAEDLVMIVLPD